MGDIGRRIASRVAMAALACLAASGLPAFASSRSVGLADGTSLTVWEVLGRAASGRGQALWSIHYSVTDASGTRLGVVPPTADAVRDSAPYLVTDASGSAVMVWSRFDGSYRKIAYARFSGGAWTDFHYLTFGRGDDDEPRIGTDMAGSFLFYVSQPDKYQYAPLDLMTGRLFAAPRLLNLGSARRDIAPMRPSGSASTQAGVDVPVTGLTPPGKGGGGKNSSVLLPSRQTIEGAVDVPVAQHNTKAIVWGVGSSGDCASMVLVIPDHDMKTAFVLRFTAGFIEILWRVDLPAQIEDRFGEGVAASHLPLVCNH